ncbi:uncharacterized protein PHACADRAFT_157085 [Phanerochaete carnosa HHB-10118-sp]|uniref:Uncharacterized protein n=1 Tax=Phanerochaete carnosa (strain HHB-10118-sp) TaxID=650164 RepID=K5VFS9_PHACS|nr:uncharacterized protein PHACADRAFT_157085 [Phanerochaete carnosa HHB-10118-sp]EKM61866.1 hypothetical protein PHACADRAFT_157085 [Phanerochaete carnosa HHB-10118-sp]
MEAMLETYRTLSAPGMGRKEKGDLGGLGGISAVPIYFIEMRARVQDIVVLMNWQLYMVDPINHPVDFHRKKTYEASTKPGRESFSIREDEVVLPLVFMDVACRLIFELAGGVEGINRR